MIKIIAKIDIKLFYNMWIVSLFDRLNPLDMTWFMMINYFSIYAVSVQVQCPKVSLQGCSFVCIRNRFMISLYNASRFVALVPAVSGECTSYPEEKRPATGVVYGRFATSGRCIRRFAAGGRCIRPLRYGCLSQDSLPLFVANEIAFHICDFDNHA